MIVIVKHLPGIDGPEDLKEILDSLENSKQSALFRGRTKSYDLFNQTQQAFLDITFQDSD